MRLWRSVLAAAALALCATAAVAQEHAARGQEGLTLSATAREVAFEETPSSDYVRLKLRYELRNTGTTPVILWKGKRAYTGYEISRTPFFAREDLVAAQRGGPSIDTSAVWAERRKALDRESPPPELTEILMPGEARSLDDTVTLVCPKSSPPGLFHSPSLKELEALGHVWLKFYYQVWSPNLEPDVRRSQHLDFGRGLRTRWKSFGDLRLEDISSEPIRLDLSATPRANAAPDRHP
jgi:hypothetical protein